MQLHQTWAGATSAPAFRCAVSCENSISNTCTRRINRKTATTFARSYFSFMNSNR